MTDLLWRVSAPELVSGHYGSVIEDTGALQFAVAASDGSYRFSEVGAGVKPLAFIGTLLQISKALAADKDRRIVNQIATLPKIYAGLAQYTPKARFKEVFSLGTVGTTIARSLLDFFPTGSGLAEVINDLLLSTPTIGTIVSEMVGNKGLNEAVDKEDRNKSKIYVLRISYLPEDGLREVATGEVTFGQVLDAFGRASR